MERYLYPFAFVFFGTVCSPKEDTAALQQQLIAADREFSQMAAEKGVAAAFTYFADENVIKPQPGRQPVVGKFALIESYKQNPPANIRLTWEPLRAEASGFLGYTFGGYSLTQKTPDGLRDTVTYGNYVSVWKRKKDGTWRYVLDTGNATPGPVTLQNN
jgi:ketosteroid isomerase-like protein